MNVASVVLFRGFFGCALTPSPKISVSASHKVLLPLRVLVSAVVVTEERANTEYHTHGHKQRQNDPQEPPTRRALGTELAYKSQDLLHRPVKIISS